MTSPRRTVFPILLALSLAPAALAQHDPITAREMQAHVDFLASDLLQGRDAGMPGAELAAHYIATRFQELGLQPVAPGWEMRFDLPGGARAGEASLALEGERFAGASLVRGERFSALGEVRAALVLEGDDPAGKLVVIDRVEGRRAAQRTARGLIERGALGVCFISDEVWLGDDRPRGAPAPPKEGEKGEGPDLDAALEGLPDHVREQLEEQLAQLGIDPDKVQMRIVTGPDEEIPLPPPGAGDGSKGGVQVFQGAPDFLFGSRRLSAPVLRVCGLLGEALLEAAGRGAEATVQLEARGKNFSTNVLALVEGSDPALREELVVVGAHYDHIGVTRSGEVCNGADDNASGTAAVLEIAEALASSSERPRRSVLFALWGAEEKGLVGSSAFVSDPPVPLERVAAYINLDMIARNDPGSIGLLSASDELQGWAEEAARAHGLAPQRQSAFLMNASDSGPFVRREIPTVFLFSGMHRDYHRVSDDPDRIDADKATRVAHTALDLVLRAANAPSRAAFTRPSRGSGMNFAFPNPPRRQLGVVAGEGAGPGVLVERVLPGSVAARVGIQKGDLIVRVGAKSVASVSDLRSATRALSTGKSFPIEVRRGAGDAASTFVIEARFEK